MCMHMYLIWTSNCFTESSSPRSAAEDAVYLKAIWREEGEGKVSSGGHEQEGFPSKPVTVPPLAEDRPGFERHMKALSTECKKGHNTNPEVSQ